MQFHRRQTRQRRASIILECVIASAILATCSIALLKWTHASGQISHNADTQTAASLLADNAAVRLKLATSANAKAIAKRVAAELSENQGLSVTVTSSEFTPSNEPDSDLTGIHFTITVSGDKTPATIRHTWKIETTVPPPPSNNSTSIPLPVLSSQEPGGSVE